MTREEKQLMFSLMLKDFETEEMKAYFNDMVAEIPDYIFTMPSSTSGKYHNTTQCMKYGQVFHVYMFASILNHRLRLEMNKEKYKTPTLRDAMRCVPVFHDAVKCGWNGSKHTVQDHPMLAAKWVRETKVEHDINDKIKEFIACCCESHSGQWNTDRKGNVIMPKPRNDAEFFIHECDILSSRVDLDMIIPKELKDILFQIASKNGETTEKEIKSDDKGDDFKISFGKHAGKTLKEIEQTDFDYITWLKQQSWVKEPLKTYLKQF